MATGHDDFLLGDGLTFPSASAAIGKQLKVRASPVARAERRFYDTFDARVRAAGLACVASNGWIALVEDGGSGAEIAAADAPDGATRFAARDLAPGALRDALADIVEVRALTAVAHLEIRLRTLAVLDDEDKIVVRLVLEKPAVLRVGRRPRSLPGRIRVSPVRGYDKALGRVRRTLEHELGLRPARRSLLDDAIIASGGRPDGVSSKVDVALTAEMRADAAAAAVLRRLLAVIEANMAGALDAVDPEFLHDLRVAVRRTRAVQRECKRVFPGDQLAAFRAEFRWLQRATGRARDLDVYVLEFDGFRRELPETVRGDLDPLLGVLTERRKAARRRMARVLKSERVATLLHHWARFLTALDSGGLDAAAGPDAGAPIADVAGARIARVYKRMVLMGRAIDADSPATEYHEMRKKGKELRYLLELFAVPLYPGDVVKPMVKTLKALQDTLGRHQDREVQVTMLRSLGDTMAAQPGGADALMAVGMLIERLEEQEMAARAEFAERFAAFSSRSQRRLVKKTFR